jgi:hypothetical protein
VRGTTLLALAAASAAALALAACPLPQPLAEVARVNGGTVAPPRILLDSVQPPDPRVLVGTACPPGSSFTLSATVDDANTTEAVEARWFVDYDAHSNSGVQAGSDVQPLEPNDTIRPVSPYVYLLPAYDGTTPLHIVELVVSNGFLPTGDPAAPLPNRSPADGFETQVYRWVLEYDAAGRCQ